MTALGRRIEQVSAVVMALPPELEADGLLGVGFLRHFRVVIDYPRGELRLESD